MLLTRLPRVSRRLGGPLPGSGGAFRLLVLLRRTKPLPMSCPFRSPRMAPPKMTWMTTTDALAISPPAPMGREMRL